jgi:hypothetical protein
MKKDVTSAKILVLIQLGLSIIAAIFRSVVEIAWGIAGMFVMFGIIVAYKADPIIVAYKADPSIVAPFLKIAYLVLENWAWFFIALLLINISAPVVQTIRTLKLLSTKDNSKKREAFYT